MNQIEVLHVNDLCSLSDHDYTQFDKRIDFYDHLEHFLRLNGSIGFDAATKSGPFTGDILDTLNLRNLKLNRSSFKRVCNILDMIKFSEAYERFEKLMFIRALVCWEVQFPEALQVIQHISEFTAHELDAADALSTLGTFKTRSGSLNTLFMSLHSRSLVLVSTLVDSWGAASGLNANELAECLRRSIALSNNSEITKFLLRSPLVSRHFDNTHSLLLLSEAVACADLHMVGELLVMFDCVDSKGLIDVLKYINLRLNIMQAKWMDVERVFKLVFDKFKLNLGEKLPNNQSLFALCFEFDNESIYKYLLCKLKDHSKWQEILIETISEKLRTPQKNPNVFTLLELLLSECEYKHSLYSLSEVHIRPCDYDLHSTQSYFFASIQQQHNHQHQHPWFIKHRLLAKFDIVPMPDRLRYLSDYVPLWAHRRRSSYISASSINRYLTIDELVVLISSQLCYLVRNALVQIVTSPSEWMRKVFEIDNGNKLDSSDGILKALDASATRHQRPFALKMLARNAVRRDCQSLCDRTLAKLGLPLNLVNFMKNANY